MDPHDPASAEALRLEALGSYRILDTPEEEAFDDLAALAAQICATPMAVVSLVDRDRLWYKARVGIEKATAPRLGSFCAEAILAPGRTLVVTNSGQDPIRFYAGVPLVTPEGHALGTLCVMDRVPRALAEDQLQALRILAREVMAQMELRKRMMEFEEHLLRTRTILDMLVEGVILRDAEGRLVDFNPSAEALLGAPLEPLRDRADFGGLAFVDEEGRGVNLADLPSFSALRSGESSQGTVLGVQTSEGIRWLETNTRPFAGGVVVSFWDLTDRKRLEERLRLEATHDALTGLPNRRALEARLPKALAAARRHGTPLALCICDLDHFKELNDTQGHAAGDEALQAFARALEAGLRQEDFPARLGGDEFCVLFEGSSASRVVQSLDRIRQAFARAVTGTGVTATFGLADWRPGMDEAALHLAADTALYRAKAQGRNRVAVAEPEN